MRVLVSAFPAVGHLFPVLPLAEALRRAGHEVAVLTAETMRERVPAGFRLLPVGPGLERMLAERGPRPDTPPISLTEAIGRFFAAARLEIAGDDALAAAGEWAPDLVVCEALDALGPLIGAAQGIPVAVVGLGPVSSAEVIASMDAGATPYYAARGLRLPRRRRLDPWPEPLRPVGCAMPPGEPLRPVTVRPADPGLLPAASESRPTALITFGTVFDEPGTLQSLVDEHVAAGFAVLVALGPRHDAAAVTADPDTVRVLPFAPLDALLPAVDVVVCHGGAGTVLATLANARPLVIVPQGADHDLTAAGVSRTGAGIVLGKDVPAADVAAATRGALTDAAIGAAARRVAEHIAAMPAPDDIAATLAAC